LGGGAKFSCPCRWSIPWAGSCIICSLALFFCGKSWTSTSELGFCQVSRTTDWLGEGCGGLIWRNELFAMSANPGRGLFAPFSRFFFVLIFFFFDAGVLRWTVPKNVEPPLLLRGEGNGSWGGGGAQQSRRSGRIHWINNPDLVAGGGLSTGAEVFLLLPRTGPWGIIVKTMVSQPKKKKLLPFMIRKRRRKGGILPVKGQGGLFYGVFFWLDPNSPRKGQTQRAANTNQKKTKKTGTGREMGMSDCYHSAAGGMPLPAGGAFADTRHAEEKGKKEQKGERKKEENKGRKERTKKETKKGNPGTSSKALCPLFFPIHPVCCCFGPW